MSTTMMASASSVTSFGPGAPAGLFPAQHLPAAASGRVSPAPRRRALLVRASKNEDAKPDSKAAGFLDAMAFDGPAPERINGRLAMVGFVSALAVEATRGDGLLAQAGNGTGLTWFAYATVVLSAASLAPLLQGESVESRSGGFGGFFTADAELWNGRLAMLGLVALAATEYLTGAPLVNA